MISENEKESQALGDVDPTAVEEENFEFMFSLEDVKKRYINFLKLEPSDFESHAEEPEDQMAFDGDEDTKGLEQTSAQENKVKEELIDELKKLDISNQEEAAYVDINYWKPVIDCDVDNLLAELNQ